MRRTAENFIEMLSRKPVTRGIVDTLFIIYVLLSTRPILSVICWSLTVEKILVDLHNEYFSGYSLINRAVGILPEFKSFPLCKCYCYYCISLFVT